MKCLSSKYNTRRNSDIVLEGNVRGEVKNTMPQTYSLPKLFWVKVKARIIAGILLIAKVC